MPNCTCKLKSGIVHDACFDAQYIYARMQGARLYARDLNESTWWAKRWQEHINHLGGMEMAAEIKYPEIEVQLTGRDGNALSIVGCVRRALREAKVPREEIKQFQEEALSGDYNNVLQTAMRWVTIG